jgi:hypothetical protein
MKYLPFARVDRCNVMCGALFALGTAAVLIACASPRGTLPAAATMQFPPAGTTQFREARGTVESLTVTLSLSGSARSATTVNLYAYPLPSSGPLAKPAKADLVASADVASGSKNCIASASGRTCTISADAPSGMDAIVGNLFAKKQILAQSFTSLAVNGESSLALEAGTTSLASLSLAAPLAIKGSAFNVGVGAYASNGSSVMLAPSTPITVNVYGPTGVVPHPEATVSGIGETASFTYSGQSFVNPMSVAAVVSGGMSNTAQIFPRTKVPMACAPLTDSPVASVSEPPIPKGFNIWGSVAGSKSYDFGLDTGSTTLLIASSKVQGVLKKLVGPGQAAHENLEPRDVTVYGNYYLASVTLYKSDNGKKGSSIGTTVPMEVLVTKYACTRGKMPPSCPYDDGSQYMGVGFGRPSPSPTSRSGGLIDTPLTSTFMQLAPVVEGTMHPGFIMTPNTVQVGINQASASEFPRIQLAKYPDRPGDWQGPPACLKFSTGGYYCGHMLLDIGIASSFIHVTEIPPQPTTIEVFSPNSKNALLNYSYPSPLASPTPPAPTKVDWIGGSENFVNTGRNALAAADYLYDAGCGEVGFEDGNI